MVIYLTWLCHSLFKGLSVLLIVLINAFKDVSVFHQTSIIFVVFCFVYLKTLSHKIITHFFQSAVISMVDHIQFWTIAIDKWLVLRCCNVDVVS